jgi:hypothetical protein
MEPKTVRRYGIFTATARHHRVGMRWYKRLQAALGHAKTLSGHYKKLAVEEYDITVDGGGNVSRKYIKTYDARHTDQSVSAE